MAWRILCRAKIFQGHNEEERYQAPLTEIGVENDPKAVIAGRDPQLECAVSEVLRMMRDEPRSLPERPASPVKTR